MSKGAKIGLSLFMLCVIIFMFITLAVNKDQNSRIEKLEQNVEHNKPK